MDANSQTPSTPTTMNSPLPTPILTTTRLLIRPLHPHDSHSMALHGNSPLIAKYMSLAFPDPYTLSHAESWIALNTSKPMQHHFSICEASSPELVIGSIGLKLGADVELHTAEVGFWIGEAYWGKGYMTEALEGFTAWALRNHENEGKKTTRLWGGVFGGNIGSMRCFEKCGYVKEGVMKGQCEKRGEVMDKHFFGLTKRDWEVRMSSIFNNY